MAIPKLLHQIWIGPDVKPDQMIEGWQRAHPQWQHYLWNERSIDNELTWTPGQRAVYDQYIKDERFCGAANVARILILHQYGGVYIDADMTCRHALDTGWFMRHENWISQSPHDPERFQNAAMGAIKGSALMSMVAFDLSMVSAQDRPIHPSWQCTGAVQIKKVYEEMTPRQDLAVVPSPAFHPRKKNGAINEAINHYSGLIYADHKFYSTHGRSMSV